jgi:hypothetical protein
MGVYPGLLTCCHVYSAAARLLQAWLTSWRRKTIQALAQCYIMATIVCCVILAALARICHLEKELAALRDNVTQLQNDNADNGEIMAQDANELAVAVIKLGEAEAVIAGLARDKAVSCMLLLAVPCKPNELCVH